MFEIFKQVYYLCTYLLTATPTMQIAQPGPEAYILFDYTFLCPADKSPIEGGTLQGSFTVYNLPAIPISTQGVGGGTYTGLVQYPPAPGVLQEGQTWGDALRCLGAYVGDALEDRLKGNIANAFLGECLELAVSPAAAVLAEPPVLAACGATLAYVAYSDSTLSKIIDISQLAQCGIGAFNTAVKQQPRATFEFGYTDQYAGQDVDLSFEANPINANLLDLLPGAVLVETNPVTPTCVFSIIEMTHVDLTRSHSARVPLCDHKPRSEMYIGVNL